MVQQLHSETDKTQIQKRGDLHYQRLVGVRHWLESLLHSLHLTRRWTHLVRHKHQDRHLLHQSQIAEHLLEAHSVSLKFCRSWTIVYHRQLGRRYFSEDSYLGLPHFGNPLHSSNRSLAQGSIAYFFSLRHAGCDRSSPAITDSPLRFQRMLQINH